MPIVAPAIASSLTGIVTAITNISDMEKRRKYEQSLAALDFDQKIKLNQALLAAGSEQARQQLLADTLGKLDVARINALGSLQAEKEKTRKTLYIVGGIAVIITIIGYFVISKRR